MVWEFENAVRRVDPHFTVPMWDFTDIHKEGKEGFMDLTGGRNASCVRYGQRRACANVSGLPARRAFSIRELWIPQKYVRANAQLMHESFVSQSQYKFMFYGIFGYDATSHHNIAGCMDTRLASATDPETCSQKRCLEGDAILFLNHAFVDYLMELSLSMGHSGWKHTWWHHIVHEHHLDHPNFDFPPIYKQLVDNTLIPDTNTTIRAMVFNHSVSYVHPSWWSTVKNASKTQLLNYFTTTIVKDPHLLPAVGNSKGTGLSWTQIFSTVNSIGNHTDKFFPCQHSLVGRGPCHL